MNRFMGMMPSDEIDIRKSYIDSNHNMISVEAGKHGWTITYSDQSNEYADTDDTAENNLATAILYLESQLTITEIVTEEKNEDILFNETSLTQERTRIISGFPGTGKSYYFERNKKTTLDSDSSEFSWIIENGETVRDPDFPENYIRHIKENIGKYDFILVSSHSEVRDALKNNCLFYYLAYPEDRCKETYIQRYKDRGSPEAFINLISENWDNWLKGCKYDELGTKLCSMSPEWTITNVISHIICSENGDA